MLLIMLNTEMPCDPSMRQKISVQKISETIAGLVKICEDFSFQIENPFIEGCEPVTISKSSYQFDAGILSIAALEDSHREFTMDVSFKTPEVDIVTFVALILHNFFSVDEAAELGLQEGAFVIPAPPATETTDRVFAMLDTLLKEQDPDNFQIQDAETGSDFTL